ncbi:MAG: DUF4115 domain-containing protein [Acidimicrobiaceae bacterium]|nr:DUF4115 domain-containing protein [Acidimicrobiaceae bacterium]
MTTLLTIALVVVVAGAISGATMTAFRRERRSIARYKQMINVMEDISANGPVSGTKPRSSFDSSRSHVRKIGSNSAEAANVGATRESAPDATPRELIRDLVRPDELAESQAQTKTPSSRSPLRSNQQDSLRDNQATMAMPRLKITEDRPVAPSSGSDGEDDRPEFRGGTLAPGFPKSSKDAIPTVPVRFVITALVVIVVLGVAVVGFERFRGGSTAANSPTTTTTIAPKATTTTTKPLTITPQSQNGQGATFAVPAGTSAYVLSVTAPCWVEYSTAPYGKILWDAVIQPGSTKTITTAGPIWMRAGNSTALRIAVNSVNVAVTTPSGPFNYTFTPTPSAG